MTANLCNSLDRSASGSIQRTWALQTVHLVFIKQYSHEGPRNVQVSVVCRENVLGHTKIPAHGTLGKWVVVWAFVHWTIIRYLKGKDGSSRENRV